MMSASMRSLVRPMVQRIKQQQAVQVQQPAVKKTMPVRIAKRPTVKSSVY